MEKIDYERVFRCPTCGSLGAIYLAKVNGPQVIIKQRCPEHGGRVFKLPLKELDSYINLILDGIYRCYTCGGPALPGPIQYSGPYAVINSVCQNTNRGQKTQKIWSTIFLDAIKNQPERPDLIEKQIGEKEKEIEIKEPEPESKEVEEPISEKLKICPNCGTELEGNEKFCGICGFKLTD